MDLQVISRAYLQGVLDREVIGGDLPMSVVASHRVFREVQRDEPWECVEHIQSERVLSEAEIMEVRHFVVNLGWIGFKEQMDPAHGEAYLMERHSDRVIVRLPWFIGDHFGFESEA